MTSAPRATSRTVCVTPRIRARAVASLTAVTCTLTCSGADRIAMRAFHVDGIVRADVLREFEQVFGRASADRMFLALWRVVCAMR